MVLHGIELQHTEFHCISLYSIVLHGIAWFCFVLHGIVCLTMCSITYFWYVKLWGLPRRVFTLSYLIIRKDKIRDVWRQGRREATTSPHPSSHITIFSQPGWISCGSPQKRMSFLRLTRCVCYSTTEDKTAP